MKSPHFGGQMLAVCLSGMIAFSPAFQVQSRLLVHESSVHADTISVRHLEAGHYRLAADLPAVLEVRMLLEHADAIADPPMERAQLARLTLRERYGARMTEGESAAHYVYVWIEGQWVLVCSSRAEFQIDFGAWGHVVVETLDHMRVP